MECEDFDVERYVELLIILGGSAKVVRGPTRTYQEPSVLEYYAHCSHCEEDSREFDEYLTSGKVSNEDAGFVSVGLDVIRGSDEAKFLD